jgi:hypothetical protein
MIAPEVLDDVEKKKRADAFGASASARFLVRNKRA